MALKQKKQKKKQERKPRAKPRGKLFILDGRTGMNRDIPLSHGGGSPNLINALTRQGLLLPPNPQPQFYQASQPIQTPDAFKVQQDIKEIKATQAGLAETIQKQDIQKQGKVIPMSQEKMISVADVASSEGMMPKGTKMRRTEATSGLPKMYGQEIDTGPAPIVRPPREVRAPMKTQPNPFDTYGLDGKVIMRDLPAPPVDYSHSLVGMDGGGLFSDIGLGAVSASGPKTMNDSMDINQAWAYFQQTGQLPP